MSLNTSATISDRLYKLAQLLSYGSGSHINSI